MAAPNLTVHQLRGGMVGLGMIFDETYRPVFETLHAEGLYRKDFGYVDISLAATATRTGRRARAYRQQAAGRIADFRSFDGPDAVPRLLAAGVDFVCVATPDDRHFEPARLALEAGKHVLIEKPSVLRLDELDRLERIARDRGVLAKVVYHKLLDPDHKRLRTLVVDGVLRHVNNGYCSLLEPKQISGSQFAEWIGGRNPATYVAVHYVKLIDFNFGGRLRSVTAAGQRGLVGAAEGDTWDSVQVRLIYVHADRRTAAFDIHTSWVTPDNFPGAVEQEVQFRFDNGVWLGHARRRGVELTVEGETPGRLKSTLNNHYNALSIEPWSQRTRRGYGVEAIRRFVEEVAAVEFGGPTSERRQRLNAAAGLAYNDLGADRQVVATTQAVEAILDRAAHGVPDCIVMINQPTGGLVLFEPGRAEAQVLYEPRI